MSYDDKKIWSLTVPVAGLGTAAEHWEGYLPVGYQGRLIAASLYATTALDGQTVINVGTEADKTAYGVLTPAASTSQYAAAVIAVTGNTAIIPTAGLFEINNDGAGSTGAGDLTLTFEVWI